MANRQGTQPLDPDAVPRSGAWTPLPGLDRERRKCPGSRLGELSCGLRGGGPREHREDRQPWVIETQRQGLRLGRPGGVDRLSRQGRRAPRGTRVCGNDPEVHGAQAGTARDLRSHPVACEQIAQQGHPSGRCRVTLRSRLVEQRARRVRKYPGPGNGRVRAPPLESRRGDRDSMGHEDSGSERCEGSEANQRSASPEGVANADELHIAPVRSSRGQGARRADRMRSNHAGRDRPAARSRTKR